MLELTFLRKSKSAKTNPSTQSAQLTCLQLEDRSIPSVSFGYDNTRISNINIDEHNVLIANSGGYIIGSKTGADDPATNYISVGSNGSTLKPGATNTNPPPPIVPYSLSFSPVAGNSNKLNFSASIGPVPVDFATFSLALDFNREDIRAYQFDGSQYYFNNSNTNLQTSTPGKQLFLSDIPRVFEQGTAGQGRYVGVSHVANQAQWAEMIGSFGTVRIDIASTSRNFDMGFYNHFGTSSLGMDFGQFKSSDSSKQVLMTGSITVTPARAKFEAEAAPMANLVGSKTSTGVSVSSLTNSAGYMSYGPNIGGMSGAYSASYNLKSSVNTGTTKMVLIDVYDATGDLDNDPNTFGRILAQRDVLANEFLNTSSFQSFGLNFFTVPAQSGAQNLQFRTYWYGTGDMSIDYVRTQKLETTSAPWVFEPENTANIDTTNMKIDYKHWPTAGQPYEDWGLYLDQTKNTSKNNYTMAFGPTTTAFTAGVHTATVRLAYDQALAGSTSSTQVARIEAYDINNRVYASRTLTRGDFPATPGAYLDANMIFTATDGDNIGFRVIWLGNVNLFFESVKVSDVINPAPGPAQYNRVYEAEIDLGFQPGVAVKALSYPLPSGSTASGLLSRVGMNSPGYMAYGPGDAAIPSGLRTASFTLMTDNNTADNNMLVEIEVCDQAGNILVSRPITRKMFTGSYMYQDFNLSFMSLGDGIQQLQFRTKWHGLAFILEDKVTVV